MGLKDGGLRNLTEFDVTLDSGISQIGWSGGGDGLSGVSKLGFVGGGKSVTSVTTIGFN